MTEFSFSWQEHTCNSLLPLSWLLKAVHSSCLCSRAPEARQVRTHITQTFLLHCKMKHTAGWGDTFTSGTFTVLYWGWQHTSPPITELKTENWKGGKVCVWIQHNIFWEPKYTHRWHAQQGSYFSRNVRFCGTSSTAHPTPVTDQGFVD